jgi:catechol 2,3-dioxygenase-like lactoylglutathione lyase family enzyme
MKIRKAVIYSYNIEEQSRFFSNLLSPELVERSGQLVKIKLGTSELEIIPSSQPLESVYHIAFNIDPLLLHQSLDYLAARQIEIIPFEDMSIVNFPDWNAQSVYFKDADGNILEFIARYNLMTGNQDSIFTSRHILSISEVGIPVNDTKDFISAIESLSNWRTWKTSGPEFSAVGDEKGLLIVVKEPRNWFPTSIAAKQLPVELVLEGAGNNFEFNNIKISFEKI